MIIFVGVDVASVLVGLGVAAEAGDGTARVLSTLAAAVVLFGAVFFCLIALVLAAEGCLDSCQQQVGLWSSERAGHAALGLLGAVAGALGVRFCSAEHFSQAAASGVVAVFAVAAWAIAFTEGSFESPALLVQEFP
jgi:hypothetical protein